MTTMNFFPARNPDERRFRNPWPAAITGLASAGLAWLILTGSGYQILPLVLLGLLGSGIAVAISPSSPLVLLAAALSALCACYGLHPPFDSARLLIWVLFGVAAAAGFLMLMPRLVRQIVFSLIIIFHFTGILSAAFNVQPAPWVVSWMWANVYRPYLQFMYLNNAYHFYSPEPGPGIIIKFYVKYQDGTGEWFEMPRRQDHPVALEYQRRLSFVEHVNQLDGRPATPMATERRSRQGIIDDIPGHPDRTIAQYRRPNIYSKIILKCYAQYVGTHPPTAGKAVASVKIYRVVHMILRPFELEKKKGKQKVEFLKDGSFRVHGADPDDPWLYFPYYQGEFSPEGELLDPRNPYLYWLIPILPKPAEPAADKSGTKTETRDYLERHAKMETLNPDVNEVEEPLDEAD